METEKTTVIDPSAVVEGKLAGKSAEILGRFKGEIEISGRLQVGEGARVEAKILADAVEISGEFTGDLVAQRLLLLEKARVSGTIDTESLAVREGAQLNGTVTSGKKEKGRRTEGAAQKPVVTG